MGPQGWWPADSKVEILLGAILVQNTNWRNVDQSLTKLRQETNFLPENLLQLSLPQLQSLIRSSGFYRQKSRSIVATINWLAENKWDYQAIVNQFGSRLRSQLLKLPGIGQETADVLLVYVFDQVEFIADHYTRKLFNYLGYQANSYQQLKQQLNLPASFTYQDAQELHGLLDEFGKKWLKNKTDFENSFLFLELKKNKI
ncbi:endonuclease III domain-containing protein [Liquorilactobacillus sicerae]|uniref:endonuclease III domain-containing protein n=1 Tax=Liquorilactobacillus sicerae TaxID=1416943 RepID=UPI00249E081A|nr:deoxyribonuclease I [Liquorilactobacillus sicerae]